MMSSLTAFAEQHRDAVYTLLRRYFALGQPLLLQSDLRAELAAVQAQLQLDEAVLMQLTTFVE